MNALTPKISILDFLRTGALGPLTIGTPRPWVRKLLGEPAETPGPQFRHRPAPMWKYGNLVLHFAGRTDTVNAIEFCVHDGEPSRSALDIDTWWISKEVTFNDAKRELADVGISFEDVGNPSDKGTLHLLAGAGVLLIFRSRSPQTFLSLRYTG